MGALKKLTNLVRNYNKIKSDILETAGDMAVSEFTLNFRKQGFNGVAWKPKKKPNGKNILIKKGNLRRSIAKKRRTNNSITIGSDLPYAYIHNNGGGKYNMPKRQFIGNMPTLTKKITNFIKNKFNDLDK